MNIYLVMIIFFLIIILSVLIFLRKRDLVKIIKLEEENSHLEKKLKEIEREKLTYNHFNSEDMKRKFAALSHMTALNTDYTFQQIMKNSDSLLRQLEIMYNRYLAKSWLFTKSEYCLEFDDFLKNTFADKIKDSLDVSYVHIFTLLYKYRKLQDELENELRAKSRLEEELRRLAKSNKE